MPSSYVGRIAYNYWMPALSPKTILCMYSYPIGIISRFFAPTHPLTTHTCPYTPSMWKPISNSPGYEASDAGQIRSLLTGKVLKGSFDSHNRLLVTVFWGEVRTKKLVAHLIAATYLGFQYGQSVHLIDGDSRNNHPDNIQVRGEPIRIETLKDMRAAGWTYERMAEHLGISEEDAVMQIAKAKPIRYAITQKVANSIRESAPHSTHQIKQLATEHGISVSYIRAIINGSRKGA